MIRAVEEHGGDVIKFAGDAILAVWEVPELSAAAAGSVASQCDFGALVYRAILCGLDAIGAVSALDGLGLHAAIGASEVLR